MFSCYVVGTQFVLVVFILFLFFMYEAISKLKSFADRKPPGVGRGRGRGREDGPGGRQTKGIGRGLDDGGIKGAGGGRGRGGPGGKPSSNRGETFILRSRMVI